MSATISRTAFPRTRRREVDPSKRHDRPPRNVSSTETFERRRRRCLRPNVPRTGPGDYSPAPPAFRGRLGIFVLVGWQEDVRSARHQRSGTGVPVTAFSAKSQPEPLHGASRSPSNGRNARPGGWAHLCERSGSRHPPRQTWFRLRLPCCRWNPRAGCPSCSSASAASAYRRRGPSQ